jgi:hypothetical protein
MRGIGLRINSLKRLGQRRRGHIRAAIDHPAVAISRAVANVRYFRSDDGACLAGRLHVGKKGVEGGRAGGVQRERQTIYCKWPVPNRSVFADAIRRRQE